MAPEDYLKLPYSRILIPDNGSYFAEILEFPGCIAQGETPNEAFERLERVAVAWIQAVLDRGQEVPSPHMSQGYGGKIALRLPKSIHKRAAQLAQKDDTSLNQFLLSAIAARVGAEDLYEKMARRMERRIVATASNVMTLAADTIRNWHPSIKQSRCAFTLETFDLLEIGSTKRIFPLLEDSRNG